MLLTVGAYKVNEKADHKSKYLRKKRKRKEKKEKIKKRKLFPAGLEPATLRVVRGSVWAYLWGARDNHYTTETADERGVNFT